MNLQNITVWKKVRTFEKLPIWIQSIFEEEDLIFEKYVFQREPTGALTLNGNLLIEPSHSQYSIWDYWMNEKSPEEM